MVTRGNFIGIFWWFKENLHDVTIAFNQKKIVLHILYHPNQSLQSSCKNLFFKNVKLKEEFHCRKDGHCIKLGCISRENRKDRVKGVELY